VSSWRPRAISGEEAAFARRVVLACDPKSPARARALLWATSRLAAFGHGVGLCALEADLLRPSVIERFVIVGLAHTSGSRRRTVRANLRFVGRRVAPRQFPPDPVPVPRLCSALPYSDAEIASYLFLAAAQPTEARRMRATGLISLGAGAGLVGSDLRLVRGTDLEQVAGVLCVRVAGRRPRLVPVLARHREALVVSAAFAGDGFVVGGISPERHNVTHRLVDSLSSGVDLSRLSLSRLRASYLASLVRAAGLPELLSAAGLRDSKAIFDLVSFIGPPDEDRVVAVVGQMCGPQPS
jgi:hypothetical protein